MSTPARRRRILLVDDDAEVLGLLADLVAAEGEWADTALDGITALEKIGSEEYDLILCDIRMAGLDGPGVYQEIERRWPHLLDRFVFIAADADAQRKRLQSFLQRTGVPIIAKPISRSTIAQTIWESGKHV